MLPFHSLFSLLVLPQALFAPVGCLVEVVVQLFVLLVLVFGFVLLLRFVFVLVLVLAHNHSVCAQPPLQLCSSGRHSAGIIFFNPIIV